MIVTDISGKDGKLSRKLNTFLFFDSCFIQLGKYSTNQCIIQSVFWLVISQPVHKYTFVQMFLCLIIIVPFIRLKFFNIKKGFFVVTERADALGKLGVFYAIGMVIGPSTGGLITHTYGERTAAYLAAFVSCVSIIIAYLFIPGNTKSISKERVTSDSSKQSGEYLDNKLIFS